MKVHQLIALLEEQDLDAWVGIQIHGHLFDIAEIDEGIATRDYPHGRAGLIAKDQHG